MAAASTQHLALLLHLICIHIFDAQLDRPIGPVRGHARLVVGAGRLKGRAIAWVQALEVWVAAIAHDRPHLYLWIAPRELGDGQLIQRRVEAVDALQ